MCVYIYIYIIEDLLGRALGVRGRPLARRPGLPATPGASGFSADGGAPLGLREVVEDVVGVGEALISLSLYVYLSLYLSIYLSISLSIYIYIYM